MVDIEFGIPFFRYHLDSKELKDIALKKNSNYSNLPINQTPKGWDCNLKTEFSQSLKVVDEYSIYYYGIIKQFSDIAVANIFCQYLRSFISKFPLLSQSIKY